MVTVSEALTEYNRQCGTAYATLAALGAVLAKDALRDAWRAKRMNDAHELAVSEGAGF
jgi:hypothetical protein